MCYCREAGNIPALCNDMFTTPDTRDGVGDANSRWHAVVDELLDMTDLSIII